MTLPTYTRRHPDVFAVQYTLETEAMLIEEHGQNVFFSLNAEFGDYIVDEDGATDVYRSDVFHRTFHRAKNTGPVISELQGKGVPITRIAEILGVSRPTVYRALNS